jgi:hypothetical protein
MTRSDPTSDAYEPPTVQDLETGQGPVATAPGITVGLTGQPTPGAAPREL